MEKLHIFRSVISNFMQNEGDLDSRRGAWIFVADYSVIDLFCWISPLCPSSKQ